MPRCSGYEVTRLADVRRLTSFRGLVANSYLSGDKPLEQCWLPVAGCSRKKFKPCPVAPGVSRPLTKGRRAIEKPIWSPDGKRIAYWILRTDEIVIADLRGKTIATIAGDEGIPKLGGFSPTGSKLVFTRFSDGGLFVRFFTKQETPRTSVLL